MDNDEKDWRRPPAWKVDNEIRDKMRDMHREIHSEIHRRVGGQMRWRPPKNRCSSLIPGAIILAVGFIFLLDSFGYVRARHFLQFWPVILILIGASKVARPDSRIWGVLLL